MEKDRILQKKPLIIIAGPTAVGKTALSIQLAKAVDGEVISADSMQVYRGMDIGSAKVTKEEMEGVPHHLIDVLDPKEDFNVVRFQSMARQAMEEIWERGHVPVIAGGTGFYIQALLRNIDFTETGGDPVFRAELEKRAASGEGKLLHQELSSLDPESAKALHPHDTKRIIRALEYYHYTGQSISKHNEEEKVKTSPYTFLYLVLNRDRAELYERINQRVDLMIENGLVEEVEALKASGLARGMVSMQGLGYKEILEYLDGECSLEDAADKIKLQTRHFAKRQLTWFRREGDIVDWVDLNQYPSSEALLDHCLLLYRNKILGE